MNGPNFWEHEYSTDGQKKTYKIEFTDNHPNPDHPEDAPDIDKIRPELDKELNKFLDAYHTNPEIPMRLEVSGKSYQVSMAEGQTIKLEKLVQDPGLKGYGRIGG
jgi:hypothetical protein